MRNLAAITLVLLTVTSCGENILGPLNNKVFVLRTIDGASLPATVTSPLDLAWVVRADTIWFEDGTKWRRRSVQEREPGVGGDPLDVVDQGTVIRQNGLLILDFECNDTGDCIGPDRLTEHETHLEMQQTFRHHGQRLVFEPI